MTMEISREFQCSMSLYGCSDLIGPKGQTIHKIERLTKTKIQVNRNGSTFTVTGTREEVIDLVKDLAHDIMKGPCFCHVGASFIEEVDPDMSVDMFCQVISILPVFLLHFSGIIDCHFATRFISDNHL